MVALKSNQIVLQPLVFRGSATVILVIQALLTTGVVLNFGGSKIEVFLQVILGTSTLIVLAVSWSISGPGLEVLAQNNNFQTIDVSHDERIVQQIVLDREPAGSQRKVDSTIIVKNYALVGVSDDYTGGVTLLKKDFGNWEIVTETGGALGKSDLMYYGVPENVANQLIPKY